MIDIEWMKNNPTHVNDSEVLELIQALSEAKEIMEDLLCALPEGTEPEKWLSRYFPDTRKEEV